MDWMQTAEHLLQPLRAAVQNNLLLVVILSLGAVTIYAVFAARAVNKDEEAEGLDGE